MKKAYLNQGLTTTAFLLLCLWPSSGPASADQEKEFLNTRCKKMNIGKTTQPQFNNDFFELLKQSDSKQDLFATIKISKSFENLSRNFVLMGHSSSLDEHNATPEYPRQISYGGNLVLATSGHPHPKDQAQANFVEGIAYQQESSEFVFFTVNYSTRPVTIDTNPQGCQVCHNGRYNWETYNSWPGAIASRNTYKSIKKEKHFSQQELVDFFESIFSDKGEMFFEKIQKDLVDYGANNEDLRNGMDSSELSRLIFQSARENKISLQEALQLLLEYDLEIKLRWDQKEEKIVLQSSETRELEGIYKHLNFSYPGGSPRGLNEFIAKNTYHKLLNDLKKREDFQSKKYALVAAMLECDNVPSVIGSETFQQLGGQGRYKKLYQDTQKQLEHQEQRREEEQKKLKQIDFPVEEKSNRADFNDLERITWFRFLFDDAHFKLGHYSPVKLGRRRKISYGFSHIGAGAGGLTEFVCFLAPEIARQNSRAHFLIENQTYSRSLGTSLHWETKSSTCKKLEDLGQNNR